MSVDEDRDDLNELAAWEFLPRLQLDLAYTSEKALNLDMFKMHVEDIAIDYAARNLHNEDISDDDIEKTFEFDVLSGLLNSEAKELDEFLNSLQNNIADATSENITLELEYELRNASESLKKTHDVVADIRKQSAQFQSDLAFAIFGTHSQLEASEHLSPDTKLKQQNEQHRQVLQMLEKSIARELDLEKKLYESKQSEQELNMKVLYAERAIHSLEESIEMIHQRIFEAENDAEIFLGISRDLSVRENELKLKMKRSMENENESNVKDSEALMHSEKMKELEEQLLQAKVENDKLNIELKDAKDKYEALTQTNAELNEQLSLLSNNETEKANSLERRLKESDIQLEHAKASVEAIEEQQNMLYSAFGDMENLIEDLKAKVAKNETRAVNAEARCALLTETNSELNEEVGYLRSRLDSVEEAKLNTAKDIGIRTKFITDLVMKLALERERLHSQVSMLVKQNKILSKKCMKASHGIPQNPHQKEEVVSIFRASEMDESISGIPTSMASMETDADSKIETVRTIEASQLSLKYLFMAVLILLVSIAAIYFFQLE